MRDFFYSFRATCLFVGTVIGAGFATGEEIKLYFNGKGDGSVILSALVFSLMSLVFLLSAKAKEFKLPKFLDYFVRIIRFSVVCLSFVAMCSAGEKIVKDFIGINFGGAILFVLCLFFAEKSSGILANVNFFIVPVIATFTVIVYMLAGKNGIEIDSVSIFPAFLYASMNVFSGGIMLRRIGKNMSAKQSVMSAVLTFLIVGALMICIKKSIESEITSMPLVSVARKFGAGAFAFITVLLSIFTTLLSDVNIMYPEIKRIIKSERVAIFVFFAFAIISSFASFSEVVQKGYPLIGYSGVVYFTYAQITLFLSFLFKKRHERVHTSCKSAKYYGATHN